MSVRESAPLKAFLETIAPSGSIEELVEDTRTGGGVTEGIAAQSEERRILAKLATGARMTPDEMFFTEAIIIPDRRPAVTIQDGTYDLRHADWLHLNQPGPRERITRAIPGIGRVELPGHPTAPYGGTAFVVGRDLLMTNRHVAEAFARGLGTRSLSFIPGRMGAVDFLREHDRPDGVVLDVTGIAMIHPYWDMALLRIEGLPDTHPILSLATGAVEDRVGQDVAVIGYPAFDPRNALDVQDKVFGGVYGVKRLQPGKMRGRADVESYDRFVTVPTHDASTLGGNSGSCVVDVQTGEILGLHFGGHYLKANYCVAASDLARDGRVIDAGVRFSGTPRRGPVPWDPIWLATEAASAPDTSPPPDIAAAVDTSGDSVTATNVGLSVATPGGEVRITVPLELTLRLGTPVICGTDTSVAPAVVAERTGERPPPGKPFYDNDYATRRGYDPDFLGLPIPLPVPRNPSELVTGQDLDGIWLHYHHFSVAMNRDRRLAQMTAAMIDASAAAKTPGHRPAGDYTRDGLAGRSSDAWFFDDRIPRSQQLAERFFEKDRGSFDKGHVVRRDDVAWGATYEEMRNANGDSFHVTNCSPQTSALNQSSQGKDNWGDLENLILDEAETEKLAVFGGPVFAADDPVFKGVDHAGTAQVQIPRRYWKLVVARKADALEAFGFVLEQDLSDVALEFQVTPNWVPFMEPVAEIERLSGFDFADAIRTADRFATSAGRAMAAAGGARTRTGGTGSGETAAVVNLQQVLSAWRALQDDDDAAGRDPARFTVELDRPLSDATIAVVLERALGLDLSVAALFEDDPDLELDRFRLVEVPGIGEADRADLFDIARLMAAELDAASVEPDLSARYFEAEPAPPPEGVEERAGFPPGCWATEQPGDPDWALQAVNLPAAWTLSRDMGRPVAGEGVVIFQPDTGIVRTHPELPATLADDPRAANFIEDGAPPVDPLTGFGNVGHGTGTGSVVASPPTLQITGAAHAATLVPVRCLRVVARLDQSRVAKAINHARLTGAHVITMSLGGVPGFGLRAAVRKAVEADIIVLAAAGNCVGTVVWPARYDEVIAVAGSNEQDLPWQGSSHGRSIDITAPAEFVLRAKAGEPGDPGRIDGGQGTSFAVALTAGIAASWLAHHGRDAIIASLRPGETVQDRFRALLRQTARPVDTLDPGQYGPGVVDAGKLLAADLVPALTATEAVRQPVPVDRQVLDLFSDIDAGLEQPAALALRQPGSVLELACIGLDHARSRNDGRRTLEAAPSIGLSRGLAATLGPDLVARLIQAPG
ncbi:MAG: hypothetical protein CML66_10935 [Rhodobacteraceae bacterium]|nr:hypothetical protein [Paracoccaceae bacterium]